MADEANEDFDQTPPGEEPKLKYRRLANSVIPLLEKDTACCMAVNTKFVCVGSKWGRLYILDHDGNIVTPVDNSNSKHPNSAGISAHAVNINAISVDPSGESIATCSDDGKVVIHELYSVENNQTISLGRVVKSVALDPNYHKPGSGKRFLVGDNKLTLYEKSFLNRNKCTVLSECEGYVQALAWRDRFVAWAGDVGVRVYDLTARCSLGLIKWEKSKSGSNEDFRCNLIWAEERTLMIGWVDTVQICVIRKRSTSELQPGRVMPDYIVDPMYTHQTDCYICGLGPLNDQLVILGFAKEPDPKTGKSQRPFLNRIDYKDFNFTYASTEYLNIKEYDNYTCNDYHLATVIEENLFFIVSPKDIIVASKYDIDDRVQWLMEHDFYDRAILALEEIGGKTSKYSVISVGIIHLDSLLESENFEEAAKLCAKVCSSDRSLWEEQIYKFSSINQLRHISRYVPISSDRKLSPSIYEMILYEYLKFDPPGFLHLVQDWDPNLYKINFITKAVIEQVLLSDVPNNYYLESLAVLYCHQKKYDKALSLYFKLQHPDVFKLIKKNNLYDFIYDKILTLMKLDCDKAIEMLLDKDSSCDKDAINKPTERTKIPIEIVKEQLSKESYYLYRYLDALSKLEAGGRYHGELVQLYADFAREKLLPFLKSSDNYPIQNALDVCKAKKFYPETAYLLGKIGSYKDALEIIVKELKDINQAITFCQEHNDNELWMDLINQSLDNPEFITLLLKRIGNYVDPRILIQGIKPGCKIDNLKDSLAKMMCDYKVQLSVQKACKDITLRNYFDIHEKLIQNHQKGIYITDDQLCSGCHEKIMTKDLSHVREMIVYNCKHSFHIECLPAMGQYQNICAMCHPVKL